MTLGEKLVELRKKKNLTQEKLAEKIGISRQTLSNWESDITSPDIKQAKRVVEIFDISLDDLINRKTEIQCASKKSVLSRLLNQECYLDVDSNDYRLTYNTKCKVIDISKDFIKITFEYDKNRIEKLIDITLISSMKRVIKDGGYE